MKGYITLVLIVTFTFGLIGCAATTERKTYRSLKSPTITFQPFAQPMEANN